MPKEILPTTDEVTVTRKPITSAPAPQTVRIYHKKDGTPQDVFPVDAKEIVAQGEYSYDPVDVSTSKTVDKATADAPPDFESMTKAELEAYAESHDIALTSGMTKAEQVEAIRAGGS